MTNGSGACDSLKLFFTKIKKPGRHRNICAIITGAVVVIIILIIVIIAVSTRNSRTPIEGVGAEDGVFETSCGQIDYDSSIDDFNEMQLRAHNQYRADHGVPSLAYDADLAE